MGRPREFDIDTAIKTATELFWRKGYEGTSLSDLTGAMRITAPSFYFAFGNKEKLFRRVIEQYYEKQLELLESALREPTVRGVAEKISLWLCRRSHRPISRAWLPRSQQFSSLCRRRHSSRLAGQAARRVDRQTSQTIRQGPWHHRTSR